MPRGRKPAAGDAPAGAESEAEGDAGAEAEVEAAAKPEAAGEAMPGDAAGEPETPGATFAVKSVLRPVGRFLTSRRAPRLRGGLAMLLVVLAACALAGSALALWSHSLVCDTDRWAATVAPVAQDPAVRHSVSIFVADQTIEISGLRGRIEAALPSGAKVLAAPLADAMHEFLVKEVDKLLATPAARSIWVDVNALAHRQLLAALQGRSPGVSVTPQNVTLDLLPLIAVALQRLQTEIPRLLGNNVTLPGIDPSTPPDQIRTLIQDATGRALPADWGTITILKGGQGYYAKRAFSLFNSLVVVVCVVAGLLVAAALVVSPHKRRTLLQLGIGTLVAAVVVRVVERQIELRIVQAVRHQGAVSVARAFVTAAVGSLDTYVVWLAVGGVIVAVVAFLAARPRWVQAMVDGFATLFGVASDLTTPQTGFGRWAADHADLLRVGGIAVALVVLLFAAHSLTALLVVVLVAAAYELALAAFAAGVPPAERD